jgi:hypothetical protein
MTWQLDAYERMFTTITAPTRFVFFLRKRAGGVTRGGNHERSNLSAGGV